MEDQSVVTTVMATSDEMRQRGCALYTLCVICSRIVKRWGVEEN